jgi:hypothetical protein
MRSAHLARRAGVQSSNASLVCLSVRRVSLLFHHREAAVCCRWSLVVVGVVAVVSAL